MIRKHQERLICYRIMSQRQTKTLYLFLKFLFFTVILFHYEVGDIGSSDDQRMLGWK